MIGYRLAEAADAPALQALLQALSDHDGGGMVGSAESLLTHGFGARPLFRAVLAEQTGVAVGMVLFYPDFSTLRGKAGVFVQDLFVQDRCRRLGIGRALLVQAMRMQDWGAAYLTLGVDPGNMHAKGFYLTNGFAQRGYDFLILEGAALDALTAP